MSSVCRRYRFLFLGLVVLTAACEQTFVHGPVGDAAVTVQELRSGNVISQSSITTANIDDVEALNPEKFAEYNDLRKIILLGQTRLNVLNVDAASWYLVTTEGGFDYDAESDLALNSAPAQIFGTINALMTGALLDDGGHVIGPLSEAAYQWVRPFIEYMTDSELEGALDEYALALVGDVRENDNQHNYRDLLTFNPLIHGNQFTGSSERLDDLKDTLAAGGADSAKRVIATDLVSLQGPAGAAEAMFRERISPDIAQGNCIQCHVSGGVAGSTRHVLVSTGNRRHLSLNVTQYENLVASVGLSTIVAKARGGLAHGGGVRLSSGSSELEDLETFLNLL